jgi:RND family efflux transporter MFP subunit
MRTSLQKSKFLTSILIAFFTLGLTACNNAVDEKPPAEKPRPVKLLAVGSLSGDAIQKFPGSILATDRVNLAFQVSGTLVNLAVREGQWVKKGDLIAELEPKDFIANLMNANGTLAKAQARVDYAAEEYRRYLAIQATDKGAVSASTVSLKHQSVAVAKADLKSAVASVNMAKNQLGYTRLTAPFSGIIAQRFVENFQEIPAKEKIVSLQNMKVVDVIVDLPEVMMIPIRNTHPRFFAEFAAAPDRQFDLKVKEIALQADPKTQTFRLVLTMPAPKGINVLPGMTTNVGIDASDLSSVRNADILIPLSALFADVAGKKMVWLVDAKTKAVHLQPVSTGELSGLDSIHITSGLEAGDTIAVSGVGKLHEGQQVRAMDTP